MQRERWSLDDPKMGLQWALLPVLGALLLVAARAASLPAHTGEPEVDQLGESAASTLAVFRRRFEGESDLLSSLDQHLHGNQNPRQQDSGQKSVRAGRSSNDHLAGQGQTADQFLRRAAAAAEEAQSTAGAPDGKANR